jgi:uncharacterized membrane protein
MKKYFITGLIILMPLALTLFVIAFLFEFFTTPFVSIVSQIVPLLAKKLPFPVPEGLIIFISRVFSLLLICALIFTLGILGRWFFVKSFFKWFNFAVAKIPVVNSIYKLSREVISALFSTDGKKIFKEPVMVPFPDKPNYCIGLRSGEAPAECEEKIGRPLVSVFAPTAPHPISGFLFILPKDDALPLDLTNEDAIKFLVSCGVILPDSETAGCPDESL